VADNTKLKLIFKGDATVMRFCQKGSAIRLAVGTRTGKQHHFRGLPAKSAHSTGRVLIMDLVDNNRITNFASGNDAKEGIFVMDLRWDPCSTVYLLVLYSNGRLVLLDTDNGSVAIEFELQKRTSGICWNRLIPGQFFTISSEKSTLDSWNVSQR
jgi:hypothetical protein